MKQYRRRWAGASQKSRALFREFPRRTPQDAYSAPINRDNFASPQDAGRRLAVPEAENRQQLSADAPSAASPARKSHRISGLSIWSLVHEHDRRPTSAPAYPENGPRLRPSMPSIAPEAAGCETFFARDQQLVHTRRQPSLPRLRFMERDEGADA
jgi:hypothetical protein